MKKSVMDTIIEQINGGKRLRVWSVIITFFGDAIVPRGGAVSAKTVSDVLLELGVGDGAVRTAFSRLANDGWIRRQKQGRNAFYSLDEKGYVPFAEAATRIYATPDCLDPLHASKQEWILGVASPRGKASLEEVAKKYRGFLMNINTVVFRESGAGLIKDLEKCDCLIMTGRKGSIPEWVHGHSTIVGAAAGYRNLPTVFENLPTDLTPVQSMAARCLLIHEWRRLIFRTPDIPAPFLPRDWPVRVCAEFVAKKYHELLPASEEWIETSGRGPHGRLNACFDIGNRFKTLQK